MGARVQHLESLLDNISSGVCMIGIWGAGGSGKTTLANYFYMKISQQFQGKCIIENVREESRKSGLNNLQKKIVSALIKKEIIIPSLVEGKQMMKKLLGRRKVLILLDDVDDSEQLEALAGKHNWFGDGSVIIFTTRDQHLLRTHKVDHVYPIPLLSFDEAKLLFEKHAYNEKEPVEDYDAISLRVISYASGLPLALKVLGSFLYDKKKNEWISALKKLKDIPDVKIMHVLKLSYDGLETYQKMLFLVIACILQFEATDEAREVFEACGYHPDIGIQVLKDKALISLQEDKYFAGGNIFVMHDLIEEMGHCIVKGEDPNNPEKSRILIKGQENEDICSGDEENDKAEVLKYHFSSYKHDDFRRFCNNVSNMKKLKWLKVTVDKVYNDDVEEPDEDGPSFLSNELRYLDWTCYFTRNPFPDSFQLTKLVVLRLWGSSQREIWNGPKHLPNLKVLFLQSMKKLDTTPDLYGLPSLQKLTLDRCDELKNIHQSLVHHSNLEIVILYICPKLRMLPSIVHMENLKTLKLEWCRFNDEGMPLLDPNYAFLSRLELFLSQLTQIKHLVLSGCEQLLKLPKLPSSLAILEADECCLLHTAGDCNENCPLLCQVSIMRGRDGGRNINDSERLLHHMLEGNAIENGSMLLQVQGDAIAMGFTNPLLEGRKYRLQLQDNWCNDFSGFIMCAVIENSPRLSDPDARITMKKVMSDSNSQDDVVSDQESRSDSEDSQDDVVSDQESRSDSEYDNDSASDSQDVEFYRYYYTWVGYVSFGSLRHTAWWDQTCNSIEFQFEDKHDKCNRFGVRLVDKKTNRNLIETSTSSSSKYSPNLDILQDSTSSITISLCFSERETLP